MSIGGIGGPARFPLHVDDRTGTGTPTLREQQAKEFAEQLRRTAEGRRLARLAVERQATQDTQLENLDVEQLRRERVLDLADSRPEKRGSVVDIEV